MPTFHQVKSYFRYWLNAVGEHSLQGPFIYDLYQKVFKPKEKPANLNYIADVRHRLENSAHNVEVTDYGAGSTINSHKKRPVKEIAKHGVTQPKYAVMLYRLIEYLEARHILELGTSLGISTLYLATPARTTVTTIEGAESLHSIALSVFEAQNKQNIKAVRGNIDHLLAKTLTQSAPLDFVFFDANHTKEATLTYFSECIKKAHDQTCFVFDDIHWSANMEEAWAMIKRNYRVTLTIDIYQMGIVFFNPELRKQHYALEF